MRQAHSLPLCRGLEEKRAYLSYTAFLKPRLRLPSLVLLCAEVTAKTSIDVSGSRIGPYNLEASLSVPFLRVSFVFSLPSPPPPPYPLRNNFPGKKEIWDKLQGVCACL